MTDIGIIGAGAWGTALAAIAARAGHQVVIQAHEPEVAEAINQRHENTVFLPGIDLPATIRASTDLAPATQARAVLLAMPAQHFRAVAAAARVDVAEARDALADELDPVDPLVVAEAQARAPLVDALLLDSGRPQAAIKELGGTGRVHDWSLSRSIVTEVSRPVFLAGGIRPENVREAARQVRPFGIDLCSGVRRNGHLDGERLRGLFAALAPAAGQA